MKTFLGITLLMVSTSAFAESTGEAGGSCLRPDTSGTTELAGLSAVEESDDGRICTVTAAQIADARRRRRPIPTAADACDTTAVATAEASMSARLSSRMPASSSSTSGSTESSKPTEAAPVAATESRAESTRESSPPPLVAEVTRSAAGHGLVTEAADIVASRERLATATSSALVAEYSDDRAADLERRLRESEATMTRMAQELRSREAASDEERRLANLASDAAARDRAALAELAEMRRSAAAAGTDFPNLPILSSPTGTAGRPALASLFAPPSSGASSLTGDEYARQLALLAGMSPNERDEFLARLGIETMDIMVGGRRIRVPRLGAGGEGRSLAATGIGGHSVDAALPCSAFLASALPDELSRREPTTLEWVAAHQYRSTGAFPGTPAMDAARQAYVQDLALHFDSVDVYRRGNRPVPGDLLVMRAPAERDDAGRLLFVENYDPDTGTVEALEFSPKTRRPDRVTFSLRKTGTSAAGLLDNLFVMRIRRSESGNCELPSTAPVSET